jgi:hypothetical protein
MRFGYTPVSTAAQTLHQQHDALKAGRVSKIYSDTMSGHGIGMIAPILPP